MIVRVVVRVLVRVLVLIALSSGVAYAGDEPDTAVGKQFFTEGSAAFKRGDFTAASESFKRGFDAEPWSGFLFAWAQSERVGGSCAAAIELYSRFIATNPTDDARKHAIGWIEVCGGKYDPSKPPKPDPPKPDPPKPEPPKPEPVDDGPHFEHKLAVGLAAGAVASGIVAVRFYTWSRRDAEASLHANPYEVPYEETQRVYDRATSRLTIARVSGGLALGLATAATLRFVLHRSNDDAKPDDVSVSISPHGLFVAGSF